MLLSACRALSCLAPGGAARASWLAAGAAVNTHVDVPHRTGAAEASQGVQALAAAVSRGFSSAAQPAGEAAGEAAPSAGGLSEAQLAIQEVAQSFAREELAPFSAEWDEKHHFPVDTLRRAAELGFGGIYVPEEVGGDCAA